MRDRSGPALLPPPGRGLTRILCPRCGTSVGLHPPGLERKKKRCKKCQDNWLVTTKLEGSKLAVTWELKSRRVPVSAEERQHRLVARLPDIEGLSGMTPPSGQESDAPERPPGPTTAG